MKERRTHIEIVAPLLEMEAASDLSALVKVDPELIREITDGDDEPRYVISDIQECKSDKKIAYDYDAFKLIADQVNEKQPTGYLGHIKDQDRDTAFPEPQVLWVGSAVTRMSDGTGRLITKGYLIPEGKARGLIKRRVVNTVSWAGDAVLVPAKEGGYKLKEFVLESIDFSRKNREGLKNQRLQLVTEEMSDNNNDRRSGGKTKVADDDKTYDEIVGRLTYSELKTLNPALVKVISEMAKDEVKEETVTAVKAKEDELKTKHDAEVAAMPEKSVMQQIMALLKVDAIEKVEDQITALLAELDRLGKEAVKNWFTTEILAKKIPNEKARSLVGRLIPVTEMEGDWRTESGQDKIKKALEDKVDDALENDEEIQTIIREMGSKRGGVRLKEMDGGNRDRHSRRNDNDDDDDVTEVANRSQGRLKVERQKVG